MKKLISFSLPPATNSSALAWALLGAVRNSEMQKKIYPGWTCRFYASSELPEKITRVLEQNGAEIIIMNDDELREVPHPCWRLLAATADVEVCLMRSATSCLGWMEKRMVDEWLASGKGFHIIRDGKYHSFAAMEPDSYGVRGGRLPNARELVKRRPAYPSNYYFLQNEVYPIAAGDVLIHCDYLRFPGEEVVPISPPLSWEEENPSWVGRDSPHFPREYYSKYGIKIKPRRLALPRSFSKRHK